MSRRSPTVVVRAQAPTHGEAIAAQPHRYRRFDAIALLRAPSAATWFAAACCGLSFGAVLHAAWTCEDAFITLRSVDNWIHGYGLRWNIDERVQSFTHPLWMLVVAAAYALIRSPLGGLVVPSLVTTAAFLALFVRCAPDRRVAGALVLLLTGTKAFVEFSSPGLENPLVNLLLVPYAAAVHQALEGRRRLWPVVGFAALLLVTRADLLWLIGPSLLAAAWAARREVLRWPTALALAPAVAWHAFALIYYGFLLPNTAYAKLDTEVPRAEALEQGLRYLEACCRHDPVSAFTLGAALLGGLASRERRAISFGLGVIAWLAYLVLVGGDFMLGRLLTPALALGAITLSTTCPLRLRRLAPWAAAAILTASITLPRSPLWGAPRQVERRWLPEHVTDERAMAYPTNGVFHASEPGGPRAHPWVREVLEVVAQGERVRPFRSVGIVGYYAGPQLHIVDEYGLADPLLARLPADPDWSPGHFHRQIPAGYLETLESGQNRIVDVQIAARYDELSSIVKGPVWSRARLKTILDWNVQRPRIYPFDYQVRQVPEAELRNAPGGNPKTNQRGVYTTGARGLAVVLDGLALVERVELTIGSDDRYELSFRRGEEVLRQVWLGAASPNRGRLSRREVVLPEALAIDSLLIRGRQGDLKYHVGCVLVGKPD